VPQQEEQTGFVQSALPVAFVGLAWAALSLWLHQGDHVPSGPVFVAPRAGYYAAQAAFALPVLMLQFWVLIAVCALVAGVKRSALPMPALAKAYALPLFFLWLLPDALFYALWGFEALARVVRVAAPITALVTVLLVARSLQTLPAVSVRRATFAALSGSLSQAIVGGAVLR
jgi:hypothetical protein